MCCYFEELKIDCAIDFRPDLSWSMAQSIFSSIVQFFFLLFKERISKKFTYGRNNNARSLCLSYTGTFSSTCSLDHALRLIK